ncbi:MAG: two-component system response regulator DegU [Flavobacteriales bacterium]|jgi:two-component system response regulator DegU
MHVLVVDDHPIYRKGVITLLNSIRFITKCHQASDGKEALEKINEKDIDVVLLDLDMPVMNGIQFLDKLNALKLVKRPKIIIMSVDDTKSTIIQCYRLRIDGFLNKSTTIFELNKLFNLLLEDETYYCKSVSEVLYKHLLTVKFQKEDHHIDNATLNHTEIELLRYVCLQYTIKELAECMGRSFDAVKSIRYRLYKKIGVNNMIGALLYGIENRYLTIDELKKRMQK